MFNLVILQSTQRDLQEFENDRATQQKIREEEFAERRKALASQMMGDILSEKLMLPKEDEPSERDSRAATKGRRQASPIRKKIVKAKGGKGKVVSAWGGEQDADRMDVYMDDFAHVKNSYDYDVAAERTVPPRTSWEASHSSSMPHTHTATSGGLGAYTRHLEDMQESWEEYVPKDPLPTGEQAKPSPIPEESEPTPTPPAAAARQKPLAEMVRLQRPEVTRKDKGFKPKPQTYQERLSGMTPQSTPRSTSRNTQQRLYGRYPYLSQLHASFTC